MKLSNMHKNLDIFRVWIGPIPNIIFHKQDRLDLLFSSSKHTKKGFSYDLFRDWLKDGLLLSYGDKWSYRRRLITPAFHFDILKDFFIIMNDEAAILIDILKKLASKQDVVNVLPRISHASLDIICQTAMGLNVDAQQSESDYIEAVSEFSELAVDRALNPFTAIIPTFISNDGKLYDKYIETMHKFTRKVIKERSDERANSDFTTSKRKQALLDLLLKTREEEKTLTLEDIQEEIDTFMFEGHDTTTSGNI
jgi:cytochrome P450